MVGKIMKIYDNRGFVVSVEYPQTYILEKQGVVDVEVTIIDPRKCTALQRAKVFGMLTAIAKSFNGFLSPETLAAEKEYLRALLTDQYCTEQGIELFSLSTADVTTVYGFINYLVDFCITHDVVFDDKKLIEYCVDISRYIYNMMANRKCVICGKAHADLHHAEGSKIGLGGDRLEVHHLGRQAITLCRIHHQECESEEAEFMEKHCVYPLRLDEFLCRKLKLKL